MFAGSDNKIFIWNVGEGEAMVEIDCFPDIPLSASWNRDGSKIVTTCKDKKLRIVDPRTGAILKEVGVLLYSTKYFSIKTAFKQRNMVSYRLQNLIT